MLGWVASLQAQDPTATFTTRNEQLQKDVYDDALGTIGLLLSFEYYYNNLEERLSLQYPKVSLYQEGLNLYTEQQKVLVLKTNEWEKAKIFIPYRKINLLEGRQEQVTCSVQLDDFWNYNNTISYQQPQRYKIDLQIRNGAVKQKLTPYDKGGPMQEWLPDPYFTLTTNGGNTALYTSKVAFNQYKLPAPAVSVYLLEGERLLWSFYDRDGAEDELLGVYEDFINEGTVYEDYFGVMFGAIKGLEFTYARKAQVPQAINVYSDPTFEYQGKSGVALTVKYDLPEAYVGQEAQPMFSFYDKNGIQLDVPVLYPLDEAVALDETMTLTRRGQLRYFVPFYGWKEVCKAVEFSFLREGEERIRAARHIIRQPIRFDDWVIGADLAVLHGARYQGARGIELQVRYELTKVYEDAPLYVKFYREDGSPLPFEVHHIKSRHKGSIVAGEHKIRQPRVADRLSYFVPYSVLEDEIIAVRTEIVPDVALQIFEKFTPVLSGKGREKDVDIQLGRAGERFRSNNYGQVIELDLNIPAFYRKANHLHLEVLENGAVTQKFLVEGAELANDTYYTINNDSGKVYLVLPHRNVEPGSEFSVRAFVVNNQNNRMMSDSVTWNWTAPSDLFNTDIEVALSSYKFDKKIARDTNLRANFPWLYVIEAGNEQLVSEPLNQRFSNKNKAQFNKTIRVNREDNITVKLYNTRTKRSLVLWKGDLSKWEQRNFKTQVEDKYPVKMIRIAAKVPSDYNRATRITEETPSTSKL